MLMAVHPSPWQPQLLQLGAIMLTLMVFPLLLMMGAGGKVGCWLYGRHWVARPTAVIIWTLWAAAAAVKRASPSVAETILAIVVVLLE